MRALFFSGLPLAMLLLTGAAASQEAQADRATQAPVRLAVFESFMRPG